MEEMVDAVLNLVGTFGREYGDGSFTLIVPSAVYRGIWRDLAYAHRHRLGDADQMEIYGICGRVTIKEQRPRSL